MNSLKRNHETDDSQRKRVMIIPNVKVYADSIYHRGYYLVQICAIVFTTDWTHLLCHTSADFNHTIFEIFVLTKKQRIQHAPTHTQLMRIHFFKSKVWLVIFDGTQKGVSQPPKRTSLTSYLKRWFSLLVEWSQKFPFHCRWVWDAS